MTSSNDDNFVAATSHGVQSDPRENTPEGYRYVEVAGATSGTSDITVGISWLED